MQTFIDPQSPRCQLSFEQLPRGVVRFPPHIVETVARDQAKFGSGIFTEEYARKILEHQTLMWYYAGLPVAYKSLSDGMDVVAVGWEETAKYGPSSPDPDLKIVQP